MEIARRKGCRKTMKYALLVILILSLICLLREIGVVEYGPSILQTLQDYKVMSGSTFIDTKKKTTVSPASQLNRTTVLTTQVPEETTIYEYDGDEDDNYDWREDEMFLTGRSTSLPNSKIKVLQDIDDIHVGDTIHITVITYDDEGRRRSQGGDLWYAVMYNDFQNTRSAGRVVDHDNGTYSIYFYAAWKSYAFVDVTLVYTRLATQWLRYIWWPAGNKETWVGHFRAYEKNEQTYCALRRDAAMDTEASCIFRNALATGNTSFICGAPPTLPCSALHSTSVNYTSIGKSAVELVDGKEHLFNSSVTMASIPQVVTIKVKEKRTLAVDDTLPTCRKVFSAYDQQVGGYWLGNKWMSLICDVRSWEKAPLSEIRNCLAGKQIFALGDSVRQFYEGLIELAGFLKSRTHRPTYHEIIWTTNTNFTFYSPPWPAASIPVNVNDTKYEVDIIEGLHNLSCNYVIIISSYINFLRWPRESYKERMVLVRDALLRLRERCPNTFIAIKGTKAKEHVEPGSHIHSSDYILYEMNKFLSKLFRRKGFYFLDVWEMNLSHPAPNRSSMPVPLIRQEVSLFLSLLCS
ncbi:NXPE family member 3-like isoform X1 [Ptychodera flava]|uniref:NXPE family member 3-like isoform X1 n=1 Tax=Ptychodera flava TaxID=63121 RepID=UPI00396A2CE6